MKWTRNDGYVVTDERERLDLSRTQRWLSEESYWAKGRSLDDLKKSIEHSVVLGCFSPTNEQVGFARWITDTVTFAWLCDVFIDEGHRSEGLGKFLVGSALKHPAVLEVRRLVLGTRDAHGLYGQFGFEVLLEPARWMERRNAAFYTERPGADPYKQIGD
jgi:GNAT superfamily N-acetyltransferase